MSLVAPLRSSPPPLRCARRCGASADEWRMVERDEGGGVYIILRRTMGHRRNARAWSSFAAGLPLLAARAVRRVVADADGRVRLRGCQNRLDRRLLNVAQRLQYIGAEEK